MNQNKKQIEIIAEIGLNWNGDMDTAYHLVNLAKVNGADVVKFQLFDTDKVFSKNFKWYELIKKCQWTENSISKVKDYCDDIDIEFLASVFDVERLEWTEGIRMKRYKIASRSINDTLLINAIENTNKDIIASLGMWNETELPEIKTNGNIDFLYCVSKYPTPLSDIDFTKIDFRYYSGFSDHTIGIESAMIAISRGAKIIEKHFTIDSRRFGPDHICSMIPKELLKLSSFRDIARHVKCHKIPIFRKGTSLGN